MGHAEKLQSGSQSLCGSERPSGISRKQVLAHITLPLSLGHLGPRQERHIRRIAYYPALLQACRSCASSRSHMWSGRRTMKHCCL